MAGHHGAKDQTDERTSVWSDIETSTHRPRAVWARRIGTALLALVITLGATGVLGERTARTSATVDGREITVIYPDVVRSGRDAPLIVRVTQPGGFDSPTVDLAFTASYFEIFDHQRFYPEPDSETSDGTWVRLSFEAPPGEVFELRMDMNAEPRLQLRRDAQVTLVLDDELRQGLDISTTFIP